MATALADLIDRIQDQYLDEDNFLLSDAVVTEAITLAIADISLASGSAETLEGLDGAAETTLSDVEMHCLAVGSGAYCMDFVVRSGFSTFTSGLEQENPAILWGKELRMKFGRLLESVRVGLLQNSADNPDSEWEWDEDDDWAADGGS